MPHAPIRRSPKIGPNDRCPCGSGRKFKKCHGGVEYALPNLLLRSRLEKKVLEEGKRLFEEHKAKELQRIKQQGLGRPIISTEFKGYRFVAVGNRVHWGKWKTFYDFLGDYIKDALGSNWGNSEIKKPFEQRHPVLQWYDSLCQLQKAYAKNPGEIFSMPMTGAASAYTRLAYNLYLIAHNGKDIQTRLIERLKNKDNFYGAFFETQVAAWLIKAGFELEYEDEADTSRSHCEFTATFKNNGEKYSVEAKSRSPRPDGQAPRRLPVGRQLRQALEKKADYKRIVFIELHKAIRSKADADKVMDRAERILELAKDMEINGAPAPSAYVCLVNLSDLYALDSAEIGTMVAFQSFKIPDYMGEFPSFRAAARARERHWPTFQLLKSIEDHRDIPSTFEGELPSEVFSSDKRARIQIGRAYLVPGPEGKEVPAVITTATVMNGKAYCGFRDPSSGKSWIGTMNMTPDELADYERFPDTYFGVVLPQGRRVETAMELFDFFFESYRDTPREKLLDSLSSATDFAELKHLPQKDLAETLAERHTFGAIARGFAVKKSRRDAGPITL